MNDFYADTEAIFTKDNGLYRSWLKNRFFLRRLCLIFDPACIAQLIQVGLLQRRLRLTQTQAASLHNSYFWIAHGIRAATTQTSIEPPVKERIEIPSKNQEIKLKKKKNLQLFNHFFLWFSFDSTKSMPLFSCDLQICIAHAIPNVIQKSGIRQGGAQDSNQAKLALKQPNLNKLGDAGGFEDCGCRRS